MKKILMPGLLHFFITASAIFAVLLVSGNYKAEQIFSDPRIMTSFAVLLLVSLCLPLFFKREFLKKYFIHALILPVIWFATFTWAYAFLELPEKKHLGDYYTMIFLLFASSYIFFAGKTKIKDKTSLFASAYGLFSFFMIVVPAVYIAYYVIYHSEMDLFVLMAIFMTNAREAFEFIETVVPLPYLVSTVASVIIIFLFCFFFSHKIISSVIYKEPVFRGASFKFRLFFAVIAILFVGGFIRQMMHVFPISIYRAMNKGDGSYQILSTLRYNLERNSENISIAKGETATEGTHIIVIGESANRDHMKVFSPSYGEETTPWESSVSSSPDFFFFNRAYSNFSTTVMSLSYALTSTRQYTDASLKDAASLVDTARAAGYHTDWISFQNRSSLATAGISAIGNRADSSYWESGLDGDAVSVLKELPPAAKRIIFIHINGSHYNYSSRVPVGFSDTASISPSDPYRDYDVTLVYTDQVLRDIFEYASLYMNLKSMIYFSDHGEDMAYYHGTAPFTYDMTHIPLWIYLSPDYQAAHPELPSALRRNSGSIFTNDLIYDTASGIWQIRSNHYESLYDLSSPSYGLADDEALTLHGTRFIKDDPSFK